MNTIKIYNNSGEVLAVELSDILECIEYGDVLVWSILWLEIIGDISTSVPELEKSIQKSKNGLPMEWNDLKKLASRIDQVIEMLLIADNNPSNLKRYNNDQEMYDTCEFTIELIDSSYWLIHSPKAENLNKIKKALSRSAFVVEV